MKIALISGAAFCGLSVVLGAFLAHALKDVLSPYSQAIFETGVRYQFYHGVGILFCAVLSGLRPELNLTLAFWLFFVGILGFSGSLYGLALGLPKGLGPITPLGGLCLIAGWLALAYQATKI